MCRSGQVTVLVTSKVEVIDADKALVAFRVRRPLRAGCYSEAIWRLTTASI